MKRNAIQTRFVCPNSRSQCATSELSGHQGSWESRLMASNLWRKFQKIIRVQPLQIEITFSIAP